MFKINQLPSILDKLKLPISVDTLKNYLKNFSWMIVENFLRIFLGLTISIYVTRYLGPKDFGVLSYGLSLTAIVSPLFTLGIDAILLRNIIQDNTKEKILLHTARLLKFAASVLFSTTLLLFFWFYSDNENLFLVLVILTFGTIVNNLNVYKEYVIAIGKIKYLAYASIVSLILASVFRYILVISSSKLGWFAFAFLIAGMINLIVLKFLYKKESKSKIKSFFDWGIAKKLLSDSWPLIFTSFSGILYIYADQLIIEYYLDFEVVGIYASAVRLIMFFVLIPSIISNVVYPKVIDYYKNQTQENFREIITKLYFIHFLIASLISLVFISFGSNIIMLLYGHEFMGGVGSLKLYSLSLIFLFFNPMNNKLLMIENLQKLMLGRNILGLFINLILNFILIPQIGVIGAAISTLIAQFCVLVSYYFNRQTKYIFVIQLRAFVYPFYFIKTMVTK